MQTEKNLKIREMEDYPKIYQVSIYKISIGGHRLSDVADYFYNVTVNSRQEETEFYESEGCEMSQKKTIELIK